MNGRRILAIARACAAPFQALQNPDGRRAWALLFLAGGGIASTALAGWALYLVRDVAEHVFWIGLSAMGLNLIVLTGFAGLLVRRTVKANIFGGSFEISDEAMAAAQAAGVAAAAAVVTAKQAEGAP